MTLQEFINIYTGKKLDFDGQYGAQCVDLYRFYLRDVLGKSQTPGVVGAFQIFNTLPAGYDKFTTGIPLPGDVITWNENQVKNGHVAVVVSADANGFRAFQQNAPKTGDPCNTAKYTYKNIIGWFRPTSVPVPTPMPTQYKQKILTLFNFIPADAQVVIKTGIKTYTDKVAVKTAGEFTEEVTYAEDDYQVHTINGTSGDPLTDGTVIYANPAEIVISGHKQELALGQEFNLVCLFYDDRKVIGDKPNHPVNNPVYQEGFNVISIPLSWVSNINDPTATQLIIYPDAVEMFFSHEGSHSDFFVVNFLKGLNLRDKTHDWNNGINPPQPGFPNGYPSPIYQYLDYLLELKPYWDALTQATIGTCMITFEYGGTYYVPVFAKFVPIADQDTFLELGGNNNSVKHLTAAEYQSVIVPFLAKVTILK